MIEPVIKQAQKNLLTAHQFYNQCQKIKQQYKIEKLYFLTPNFSDYNINIKEWRLFFDHLAYYLLNMTQVSSQTTFFFIKNEQFTEKLIEITMEIVGEGMIGRVAHLIINQQIHLAFKVFFDPEFIWHHGNWAEIAIGIYFKAHHITKDFPEFQFAGENWAVWEWIDEQAKPEHRQGIAYHDFAKQQKLNPLNYLNKTNYNPYLIRLDPGGIQTEYFGRKFHNFVTSIIFYGRKVKRQGLQSLFLYLIRYNIKEYMFLLISNFFPRQNFVKFKVTTNNGNFRKY